jgi:peptidoglycan/xylan/chitin deacetylase (PgdA/CDA1 family)
MRDRVKNVLALGPQGGPGGGVTVLIYHRVGGGTSDELDLPTDAFVRQLDMLTDRRVLSMDDALDQLDAGDSTPAVVLTFDDGFDEVFTHAWPHLRDRGVPFLIYLATAYMAAPMRWPGATAAGVPGTGLTWAQLEEMTASGLCSVGNHTHTHARPEALTTDELDACSDTIERRLGLRPAHFTYPWGVPVPALEPALRQRFRSASTGELGRNLPATDRMRLRRVPVRRTDPDRFFRAKLGGNLGPERTYARLVATAKQVGIHA